MFFLDPVWLLFMAPAFIFMLYAQSKVKAVYRKYSRVPNTRGISGAQAAQSLLRASGLDRVKVAQLLYFLFLLLGMGRRS
jgi:Zn-dependent membrane protease YugP